MTSSPQIKTRRSFPYLWTACLLMLPLVLGCEFSFSVGNHETHGPAPKSPALLIEAPAKQVLSIATAVYDTDGNTTRWQSQTFRRMMPESGKLTLELEEGHDGYRIEVLVPASVEVTAKLMSEGKEFKTESSQSGGMLTIKAGKLKKEEEPLVADIRLGSSDRALIADTLEMFKSGDMSGVISTGDDSLVDAPMLQTLSVAVKERLGEMKQPALEEWAAWESSHEATRCYGPLSFERGTAMASIVVRNGNVVAFDFDSKELPEDWFEKPANTKPYQELGEKMVRAMLLGDVPGAYQMLDSVYQDRLSQDELAAMAEQKLPVVAPEMIESVKVVDEQFAKTGASGETNYTVIYEASMSDATTVSLRIPFRLSVADDGKIGRLSGFFFVSKTGRSEPADTNQQAAPPQTTANDGEPTWRDRQKARVAEMIGHMAEADADKLAKLLNQDAQKLVDRDRLDSELDRIAARLGSVKELDVEAIQYTNADHNLGAGSSFEATLEFEKGQATCRVQYADHEPVGISVQADEFAAETFGAVKPPAKLVKHATDFWSATFSGKADAAYDLMIPSGNENVFPREVFRNICGRVSLPEGVTVRTLHLNDVRLNDEAENSEVLHVDVYQLLERSDQRYSPCRLRYTVKEDGEFQMVKFDTGKFEDRYPISDFDKQREVLAAMATGDVEQVLPLIHPFDVQRIHPPTFAAFVAQFGESTGAFKSFEPHEMSATRSYDNNGGQRTDTVGVAVFEKRRVKLSLNHVYGFMEGFNFQDPDGLLNGFPKRIKDLSAHEQHGERWLREMLGGEVEKAIQMLPSDFRREVEPDTDAIKKGRAEFLAETGELKSIKVVGREYVEENDLWQINYEMEFEKDGGTGYIRFESTPFDGHIFAFNYRRNKASDDQPEQP